MNKLYITKHKRYNKRWLYMLVLPYTFIMNRILNISGAIAHYTQWIVNSDGTSMAKLPRVLQAKSKYMNATVNFALTCLSQPWPRQVKQISEEMWGKSTTIQIRWNCSQHTRTYSRISNLYQICWPNCLFRFGSAIGELNGGGRRN